MVTLPLYKGATPPPSNANHALLFDKFYSWDGYDPDRKGKEDEKKKFMDKFKGACGNKAQIEAAALRHFELISSLGGEINAYKNEWHFVTGMGIDHPLENGMAWHHTLGTPYIAGSGVKGMLRAYCEVWQGWDNSKIEQIFGSSTENGNSGNYIFFDALPIKQVQLTPDVMTPHMDKWYEDGGKEKHNHANTPADWHAPVPVTFLAIKECTLLFGIAPRFGTAKNDQELKMLMELLTDALEWIGAGAKTAAGYGRFVLANSEIDVLKKKLQAKKDEAIEAQKRRDEEEQKTKELADKSPLERTIYELQDQLKTLIKMLQSNEFGDETKEAALEIKRLMVKKGKWKSETKAKKPEKDRDYQDTLVVMKFL